MDNKIKTLLDKAKLSANEMRSDAGNYLWLAKEHFDKSSLKGPLIEWARRTESMALALEKAIMEAES